MIRYDIYPIPYEVYGLEYLNLLHKYIEKESSGEAIFHIKRFSWRELLLKSCLSNERRIVHVHWETNIYGSKYLMVSIVRILYRFPGLLLLKLRGVKIVWTMHNLRAHDYPHPLIDTIGREMMWRLTDVVIIQEKNFAAQEAKRRPKTRIVFIPQGNYIGVYGPLWQGDRNLLRENYGVKAGEIILLALGSIRPYKALPFLVKIVSEVRDLDVPLRLFIFGKASQEYGEIIKKEVSTNPAIALHIGFVPDNKISEILALADYSIFYYEDSSLNSAAMMLSLSYGVPVITRDIPVSEIIKEKNGFVFHTSEELKDILRHLGSVRTFDQSAIIETVASQSWSAVASKVCHLYEELF